MGIRIAAWHQTELLTNMCRALLRDFLRHQKDILRFESRQLVLWRWEFSTCEEHAQASDVLSLVPFLAETERHMSDGPKRKSNFPGQVEQNQPYKFNIQDMEAQLKSERLA